MFDYNSFFTLVFIIVGIIIACFIGAKLSDKIISFLDRKFSVKKEIKIEKE